jgi:hypothetical protein
MDSIIKKFNVRCKIIPYFKGSGKMQEAKEFKITSDVIDDCLEESLEKIIPSIPNTNKTS